MGRLHGRGGRRLATLALRAGVHPKVVSERLGHASVSFTLDVYSHAIAALHADAAHTIADLFTDSPDDKEHL
jgi:integrase